MADDPRCKDVNRTLPSGQLAVLMDLRDELQRLNRLLHREDFVRIPRELRDIRRAVQAKRKHRRAK